MLRAKFRPRLPSEEPYRPTQGRDTSSGALVATKDYLSSLECNILGLVNHLQSRTSDTVQREGKSHDGHTPYIIHTHNYLYMIFMYNCVHDIQ